MALQLLLILRRWCRELSGCSLCTSAWASLTGRCRNVKGQCESHEVEKLPGRPELQAHWDEAGVEAVDVVVRAVSGNIVCTREGVAASMPVSKLTGQICEQTGGGRSEVLKLVAGPVVLDQSLRVGDCVAPPSGQAPLELTLLRLPGPAVEVEAMSKRRIEILEGVPERGDRCHLDRRYEFLHLGDFAKSSTMRYVVTSNEDKMMRPDEVMWKVTIRAPSTVYLNFRSEEHVTRTGAAAWLAKGGWRRAGMRSTVSSGVPNGPYEGPVYSKALESGTVDLMGSNCREGTYLVFIDVRGWA